jgi:hypothetical protein
VTRGRMMTYNFKLNKRAKTWINVVREKYVSQVIDNKENTVELIESLTKEK